MDSKKFQKITDRIQEKIGKENSSLVGDDIGLIITNNSELEKMLENKEKEIEKLKQDKENLIETNGNLLQQVAMGDDDGFSNNKKEDDEPIKPFNYRSVFDEKGNFKS